MITSTLLSVQATFLVLEFYLSIDLYIHLFILIRLFFLSKCILVVNFEGLKTF